MAPRPISMTILFPTERDAKEFVRAATKAFDVPCYRDDNRVSVIMLRSQHELLIAIAHKHNGEVIVF
jgi:hypothetical protein